MSGELSPEVRARIEYELDHWDDPDSEARKRFEAAQARMDEQFRPLMESIEASERIGPEDLSIIVY